MGTQIRLEQYDPSSEITVLAVCFVMLVLLVVSFKVRMKAFRIFAAMLGMLIGAASADLLLHYLMTGNPGIPRAVLYTFRSAYHILLFGMLHHFILYTCEITLLGKNSRKPYLIAADVLFIVFSVVDTVSIFIGRTMQIVDGAISFEGSTIFSIGYILFVLLLAVLLFRVRRRLYRQVMNGFFGVMAISLILLTAARFRTQSTFTAATFLFPLIAVMYLLHSNPYDAQLGTNDLRGLDNLIHYINEQGQDYLFMSLYMRELDENGKTMSDELRALIRHVAESYFRKSVLFQISNGQVLLMIPKAKNAHWEERTVQILEQFKIEYENFRYDYKIVIGDSNRELTRRSEYAGFIRSIHARIPENTIYRVQPGDPDKYRRYEDVLDELADIAAKQNPEDPRVLVYCQPVLNLRTGKYDTAEALMRLKLEEAGFVYPDLFIPLAEENGYIHALTKIILGKTCRELHDLIDEGYEITRISVNVSALELRDQDFCADIEEIIDKSGVDCERIAIELTESRSESDFLLMKERIEELKSKGITFYLDDFGTGYSNMERILELPFDIIKFDRSMVIAGGQDKRSEQVLGSLADLFSKLNYSVLYEGVENEKDEQMCRNLSASYLQGYKYSKPIPISGLREFLTRS